MLRRIVALATCGCLCGLASAQVQLTGRLSEAALSYVYGFGGSVNSGTPSTSDNTLAPFAELNFPFSGSSLPPIAASVNAVNSHAYEISGLLTDVESISALALSISTASADGAASAGISTNNNQLRLEFTVPNLTAYRISGNVSFLPQASRYIRLQRFNGFGWVDQFSSFSLSATGAFSNTGTMVAGSWRLITGINSNATSTTANPTATQSHQFDFLLDIGNRCSGTATLQGYVGTDPVPATVVIKQGANTETRATTINPVTGEFLFSTNFSGPVDVYLKGRTFLRKVQTGVTAGLNCCSFALNNGDCDGNNIVDIADYSLLAARFDRVLGDPLYDVRADLNGDGIVDIADYTLLALNFDGVGVDLP
ncbi:MAG: hypothetical protein JNJ45_02355 [Chthonomonas sp.]|nr:hypothetical protein [Chthonomonas sp.]